MFLLMLLNKCMVLILYFHSQMMFLWKLKVTSTVTAAQEKSIKVGDEKSSNPESESEEVWSGVLPEMLSRKQPFKK